MHTPFFPLKQQLLQEKSVSKHPVSLSLPLIAVLELELWTRVVSGILMIVHTLAFSWHEKSDTIKLHVAAAGENESVALLTPLILIPSHRLLFTSSASLPLFVLVRVWTTHLQCPVSLSPTPFTAISTRQPVEGAWWTSASTSLR